MSKSVAKNIKIESLMEKFISKNIYLDPTHRPVYFDQEEIKRHLYYAVKNTKKSKMSAKITADIDAFAGEDISNNWHGDCAIKFLATNKGFALLNGGKRLYSFVKFYKEKGKCNFSYANSTEIKKFYEKLAKDLGKDIKDNFTFDELPTKYKKAFLNLSLYCLFTTTRSKNAVGEMFVDSNKQKSTSKAELLRAEFANTEFYKIFKETADCIVNYDLNKGLNESSKPSWYDSAKKSTQDAYVNTCKGLKYTRKKHNEIFKLVLRCANCAEWNDDTSVNVHYGICKQFENLSKKSATDLVMNTIDNMGMVPLLIDTDYLGYLNIWTAVVYTFGVPSYKSYAIKTLSSAKRKPLMISGRFLKNKKEFNNALGDCIAGNKTTFKGTNITLTQDSAPGTVFTPDVLRRQPHRRCGINTVSMVLTALYNECKEAK